MARGYTKTVAVLVSDLRDALSSAVAQGAIAAAAERGLVGTVTGMSSSATALNALRSIRVQRPLLIVVEARLIEAVADGDELVVELAAHEAGGGHVTLVGASGLPFRTSFVDEQAAASALARDLFDIGYRSPLIVATDGTVAQRRARGVRETFEQAGSGVRARVEELESESRDAVEAWLSTLSHEDLLEADLIACTSDSAAIAVMGHLRRRGITPGTELGVSGFGGSPYADDVRPRLTTVDIFAAELGYRAVATGLAVPPLQAPETTVGEVRLAASTPPRTRSSR